MNMLNYIKYKKVFVFLKENKNMSLGLIFTGILADTFFVKTTSDFIIFPIVLLYIYALRMYRIPSALTFSFCLVLMGVVCIGYIATGASVLTEKAAVWLVLFWIIGLIQQWRTYSA